MDDDDEIEIHSHASPSPSPPNGRITVTVAASSAAAAAAAAVPPSQNNDSLALAPIPIQHQPKANGGGREDCWSEGATGVLIDAWGERYLELSRGNLKQKHWKEVADIVSSREDYTKSSKTDIQCKNRIDTVKKKYKMEKAKIAAGCGPSKWPFFERLDNLIGPVAKNSAAAVTPARATAAAAIASSVSLSSKVPVGIPVGIRGSGVSMPNSNMYHKVQLKSNRLMKSNNSNVRGQFRKRGHVESESSEEDEDEENFQDSDDSLPQEKKQRVVQKVVIAKEKKGWWGNSIRMLTQAMLKFGEAYEQAESAKLQQVVEMEKARMKFAKELELQRMQFLMKTQMEISQLKPCTRGGNGSKHHSGNNNHIIISNNNNSDSDN